ncbi:hypothetical protein GobsT_09190 [Gemmata obscuriglobus]|nr:hypothetical protein GobsT_09190 [Gemmata obscuriglobus]VTS00823.1 unnamed protein product [Gemmata obscuriglobus UQM 2246]
MRDGRTGCRADHVTAARPCGSVTGVRSRHERHPRAGRATGREPPPCGRIAGDSLPVRWCSTTTGSRPQNPDNAPRPTVNRFPHEPRHMPQNASETVVATEPVRYALSTSSDESRPVRDRSGGPSGRAENPRRKRARCRDTCGTPPIRTTGHLVVRSSVPANVRSSGLRRAPWLFRMSRFTSRRRTSARSLRFSYSGVGVGAVAAAGERIDAFGDASFLPVVGPVLGDAESSCDRGHGGLLRGDHLNRFPVVHHSWGTSHRNRRC